VNGTAENAANAFSGLDAFMADHYQGLADDLNDAKQNLATATTNLEAAFSREMEATRETFDTKIEGLKESLETVRKTFATKIDALNESLTGAREKLSNSRAIADALSDALDSRVFPSVEAQRQSQDAAAGYLQSLVGKEITDIDAMRAALKIVADPSVDTFATLEAYRREFDTTSGVIRSLKETAGFALSADEQAVILLEQQIANTELQSDKAVALIEKQIADTQLQSDQAVDLLQQQLDALLGVNDNLQTLASAIAAFQSASAVSKAATAADLASGGDVAAGLSAEQVYLANNPDVLTAVADGRFDSAADHYQQFGKAEGRSFAGGGYTGKGSRTGGLDGQGGFMAMMHPQETVIDHTRGNVNAELVSEIRALNNRVELLTAYQKQTTINTGNTSFDLKDIRRNGVQVEPVAGAIFNTDEVA
jgi:hypothetical protein